MEVHRLAKASGIAARIVAAIVCLGLAAIASLVGLLQILDPTGTKAADDGNPFGPPDPWWHGLFALGLALAFLVFVGVALAPLLKAPKSRR